jgi:hypothetical protein
MSTEQEGDVSLAGVGGKDSVFFINNSFGKREIRNQRNLKIQYSSRTKSTQLEYNEHISRCKSIALTTIPFYPYLITTAHAKVLSRYFG